MGGESLVVEGLDRRLAHALKRRWGDFWIRRAEGRPRLVLRVLRGPDETWIPHWKPHERYRIEGKVVRGKPLVLSYHFALCPETGRPGVWRAAIAEVPSEPLERVVENVVRVALARVAAEDGGFALHGAGVLRGGRAYILAGPSRSGKTTAVALSTPGRSMGDDFALLLPGDGGWVAPALPFDSRERAPAKPEGGPFHVAGIWRLFPAAVTRIEVVRPAGAAASLMGCAAFPWAMPDLADSLLESVRRYVGGHPFAHLHFRKSADFWNLIED